MRSPASSNFGKEKVAEGVAAAVDRRSHNQGIEDERRAAFAVAEVERQLLLAHSRRQRKGWGVQQGLAVEGLEVKVQSPQVEL